MKKPSLSRPAPTPKRKISSGGNITPWLTDPRADDYFGRSFALRLGVLAAIVSGSETLADVARRHGATRQAASRHAIKARKVFGLTTPG